MSGRMAGKVALVTGGSSGIGRATAVLLAREGAKVAVAARRADQGQATVRQIEAAGGQGIFLRTDVTQQEEVEALVRKTVQAYGQLDCAINNAAIVGELAEFLEVPVQDWRRVMEVNLDGVFFCLQAEIRALLERGGGAIVNVGSVNSYLGVARGAPYVSSKHALLGLTRSVAAEFADRNIRVNVVCPGLVATEMQDHIAARLTGGHPENFESPFIQRTPQRRMASAEEIANTILWLCSDEASFVTGSPLIVDGGVLAC